jgi:hypothetical protein
MQLMKYVCHTLSYGVLRVFDASVGVQVTNILSLMGVGASQPHYTSLLHDMKFVYYPPLHKHDLFHEDCIWLDAEEDVDQLLCICRQRVCDMVFPVLICLVMIVWLSAVGLGGRGRLAEF